MLLDWRTYPHAGPPVFQVSDISDPQIRCSTIPVKDSEALARLEPFPSRKCLASHNCACVLERGNRYVHAYLSH